MRLVVAAASVVAACAVAASLTPHAWEAAREWYETVPQEVRAKRLAPVVSAPAAPLGPEGTYTPVVLMHGVGDAGSNPGMQSLAQSLMTAYPGMYAVAVDVADGLLSFITPIQDQVDEFAATVRADPKLANGFNAIGLSQGGIIVRAYVEQYNSPPIHTFVSLCGVVNGEFDCPLEVQIIPFLCDAFKQDPYTFLFNGTFPLSFVDYWVNYDNQSQYLTQNAFLPPLNNEVAHGSSGNYTANIQSLTKVALIEATEDTVIYPYQSEQLGGYVWNTDNKTVYDFFQGPHYTQNLVGFRTLYTSGRLDFASFVGDHLRFNDSFWDTVVLPYFNN